MFDPYDQTMKHLFSSFLNRNEASKWIFSPYTRGVLILTRPVRFSDRDSWNAFLVELEQSAKKEAERHFGIEGLYTDATEKTKMEGFAGSTRQAEHQSIETFFDLVRPSNIDSFGISYRKTLNRDAYSFRIQFDQKPSKTNGYVSVQRGQELKFDELNFPVILPEIEACIDRFTVPRNRWHALKRVPVLQLKSSQQLEEHTLKWREIWVPAIVSIITATLTVLISK